MPTPLLYETHMHTPLCKHATGLPQEYAAVAKQRGLRGIIVTCHNPMPDGFSASVRMNVEEFDIYCEMVAKARAEWAGRVDVRLGLECDYFPGFEGWLEKQVESAPFHYLLGSVHPQIKEYKAAYWRGDAVAFFKQYYEHMAQAAETKLFDCLSHPDIVKNIAPSQWDLAAIFDDVCSALDRIAKAGSAMELNTSGLNKDLPEMNPGMAILAQMHARSIPVVIGGDAHVPKRAGDRFAVALNMLRETGYTHVSYFLDRKRQEIAISDALASLEQA